MAERLKIIRNKYLAQYRSEQPISIGKHLDRMKRKNQTVQDFRFYLISSSCNSSMIEGSSLTEEDYMRFKEAKIISKDLNEVDDMIEAYRFARKHDITEEALLQAHKRMSKHLNIPARYQGAYRDRMVRVWNGKQVVYTAARTEIVEREMRKLMHDIDLLCRRDLTNEEIFYYASMIHLVLVSIHPFADGNGRMARLVEKWFLFKKLGEVAWSIQSEKLYYRRKQSYYNNLHFRTDYDQIDYERSIPFLKMLPMALNIR